MSGADHTADLFSSDLQQAIEAIHAATAIYTTDPVVDEMLDRVQWPQTGKSLLDPSAGDGAFLRRALARLDLSNENVDEALRVRGYEFHPGAVAAARSNIADDLRQRGWGESLAKATAARIVLQRDFLLDGPEGVYDRCLGNPPYLRFARLPDAYKEIYGACLAKHAAGDLLHAFLDRCAVIIFYKR